MSKILYWEGIISPFVDIKEYQNTLLKLLQGDYKAADLSLKKNRNGLYTARVNRADRLLFTTVIKDEKKYLILLEVIDNHDYQKSRFMQNPNLLKEFLPNIDVTNPISVEDFEDLEENERILADNAVDETIEFEPVFYYNKNFLTFSSDQNDVREAALPMIISGAPGSGKSCIALSLLSSAAEKISNDNTVRKALYITRSERLVEQMKDNWTVLPSSCNRQFKVDFLSYQKLIEKLEPNIKNKQQHSESEFYRWFDEIYLKASKALPKISKKIEPALHAVIQQRKQLYQELRVVCAYDRETYTALGRKQSFFNSRENKALVYDIFERYKIYLESESAYDSAFLSAEINKNYDLVISDESQDLSYLQLITLMALTPDQQFCFLFDSNQSLDDSHSILSYLKHRFYKQGIEPSYFNLSATHRCPANIAQLANVVLEIKHETADCSDKGEAKEIFPVTSSENHGHVAFINHLKGPQFDELSALAQNATLTVITCPEFVNEAKKLFNTPMVFTPAEYKGQQNDTVVAFRPFQDKDFERFTSNDARDNRDLRPVFNRFFTTITRAQNTLYIVQPPYHKTAKLLQQMMDTYTPKNNQQASNTQATKQSSQKGIEQWKEQFHQQLSAGNEKQARAILHQHLNNDPGLARLVSGKEEEISHTAEVTRPQAKPKKQAMKRAGRKSNPKISPKHNDVDVTPESHTYIRLSAKEEIQFKKLLKNLNQSTYKRKLKTICSNERYLKYLFENGLSYLNYGSNVKLFIEYLNENSEHYHTILSELLFIPPRHNRMKKMEIPSFYVLLSELDGHKLIYSIFEKSKDNFIEKFTKDVLFFQLVPGSKEFYPFFNLIRTIFGKQLLIEIFAEKPELCQFINQEKLLYHKLQFSGKFAYVSDFLFYGGTKDLTILRAILDQKPENEPLVIDNTIFDKCRATHIYTNHFHRLSASLDGVKILNLILKERPEFFSNEKDLLFICDENKTTADQQVIPSTMTYLIHYEEGIRILIQLFAKHPGLLNSFTTELLFTVHYVQKLDKDNNQTFTRIPSIFEKLAGFSTSGLIFLTNLIRKRPDLFENFSCDFIFSDIGDPDPNRRVKIHVNIFSILITGPTDLGIKLLLSILELTPSVANAIKPEHLAYLIAIDSPLNLEGVEYLTVLELLQNRHAEPVRKKIEALNPKLFNTEQITGNANRFFTPSASARVVEETDISSVQSQGAKPKK